MNINPSHKNEKILTNVINVISKNNMLSKSRLIVAVSGGSDSMCMLDILIKLSEKFNLEIMVAHVNHSIRGEESDLDENFTKVYCSDKGIPFYSTKVDAVKYSRTEKISLEDAARILRYEFLNKIADQFDAIIAVAHHMDDQAETILLNLIRGSGTLGMSGISPVSGRLIRPLLSTSKEEIEDYIRKHNIPFRLDKTNLELCALRNKIRLKLLPDLEDLFGRDVTQALCRTGILCAEDEKFLSNYVREIFNENYRDGNTLPCSIITSSDFAVSSRLIRMLYEKSRSDCKNLTFKHVTALMKLCENPSVGKKTDLSDGFCGWIKNSGITITSKTDYKEFISLQKVETSSYTNIAYDFKIPMNTEKIFFDVQIFSKFVVNDDELVYNAKAWCFPAELTEGTVLRYRKPGDRIRPNRNSGSKLLKDYFIDRKVPVSKRDGMVVLANGKDILWICGIGGVYSGKKKTDISGKLYVKVWCC